MKQAKRFAVLALILTLVLTVLPLGAYTAATATTTGYTSAEDVEYKTVSGTIVNWGARGEDCTFLSSYAQEFYAGSYSWDTLSKKAGGTGTSDAYTSQLYLALQAMMKSKHTNIQNYQATRPYYCYTDCVLNDYSKVCSFYSGILVNGKWDSGKTYNREHTWPNSKGLGGRDEDDIMMLRPTISSENSSRGNKAYGESSGYFDPGADVRGDCARIVLYIYTRWGNTGRMWGTSGVMENLEILLKWMQEDPVDTWEMGRNDSVQSITGTRNVFVDYPEYAWLLFGEQIPSNMVTPSGNTVTVTPPPVDTTPPVTEPPVTEPPVTEPPVTEPPVTEATVPATEVTVPVTEATAPATEITQPPVPSTESSTAPTEPGTDNGVGNPGAAWIWISVAGVFMGSSVVVVVLFCKKKFPPVSK